ncbi:MAG: hypothetical protein IKB82_04980 [Clostridia bacterium]|nr:hypothetical protein [Clostridia bacterium]
MGISKRALMEDYYPDEIAAIFSAWGYMHGAASPQKEERVDVMEFLKM